MAFAELSNVLWRQRQLLDLLLYRMSVEQTLLVSRQIRWLTRATDEVEAVLEEMRETELVRSVVLDAVASELGLPGEVSLRELASAAPPPWHEILEEHRNAFLALTEEVSTVAQANREILGREQQATQQLIEDLIGPDKHFGAAPGYGATNAPTSSAVLDEVF